MRSYHTLEYYRMAYDHIAQRYPYWNRTSGRDHIWVGIYMKYSKWSLHSQ
jgi:hypothetical protein